MKELTKVYDYKVEAVRARLLNAFKKHRGEASVADLITFTGLPKYQVETELPALADEYRGRLKVTESGEILYSFPHGYTSRYRGLAARLKRLWKSLVSVLAKALAMVFKLWIMLMLVGYFVVFLALVVLALVASVAGSMAGSKNNNRRGSGGIGGLYLTTRLIDMFVRIWFYNELFKSPQRRQFEQAKRARQRGERRPLHKAIFSFVFGEPDPNAGFDQTLKQAFVSLVQLKQGIIQLEDFMALTGLPPDQADQAISAYLYEFEGSPEVSDGGHIYYHFPNILRRSRSDGGTYRLPRKQLRPFSANKAGANRWYAIINGINLLFGAFFLGSWLTHGPLVLVEEMVLPVFTYFYGFVYTLLAQFFNPYPFIPLGLGLVPIVFSILFWLVPAVRGLRLQKENRSILEENLRREIYRDILQEPQRVDPRQLAAGLSDGRKADPAVVKQTVEGLAAWTGADPEAGGQWRFDSLAERGQALARLRAAQDAGQYRVGKVIFDSDE